MTTNLKTYEHGGLEWRYIVKNVDEPDIDTHWTDVTIIYGASEARPQLLLRENLKESKYNEEELQKVIFKHFMETYK